jgi:hypothetical protein
MHGSFPHQRNRCDTKNVGRKQQTYSDVDKGRNSDLGSLEGRLSTTGTVQ